MFLWEKPQAPSTCWKSAGKIRKGTETQSEQSEVAAQGQIPQQILSSQLESTFWKKIKEPKQTTQSSAINITNKRLCGAKCAPYMSAGSGAWKATLTERASWVFPPLCLFHLSPAPSKITGAVTAGVSYGNTVQTTCKRSGFLKNWRHWLDWVVLKF